MGSEMCIRDSDGSALAAVPSRSLAASEASASERRGAKAAAVSYFGASQAPGHSTAWHIGAYSLCYAMHVMPCQASDEAYDKAWECLDRGEPQQVTEAPHRPNMTPVSPAFLIWRCLPHMAGGRAARRAGALRPAEPEAALLARPRVRCHMRK